MARYVLRLIQHEGETRSRHFRPAVAKPLLHARPQYQHQAQCEDARGQGPQEEDGVIVVRDHQRLVERTFGELAENETDHQTDERVAVAPQEITLGGW